MNNALAALGFSCLLMLGAPVQAAPVNCASMAATARLVARYRQLGGPLSDIASNGSIGSSKARRELAAAIYREGLDEAEAVQRAMRACGKTVAAPPQSPRPVRSPRKACSVARIGSMEIAAAEAFGFPALSASCIGQRLAVADFLPGFFVWAMTSSICI